jgi:hypothetical protein
MGLNLFIDSTDNALLAGQFQNANVNPTTLPLFYGDSAVTLNVYVFTRNPQQSQSTSPFTGAANLTAVPPVGALSFWITAGTVGGTVYAAQNVWTADPTNTFWTASIALNTTALQAAFTANPAGPLSCTMQFGLNNQTILSVPIFIAVGLPQNTVIPAPGLTPISLQQANQLYVPVNAPAGFARQMTSPAGHTFVERAVDNPDGSSSVRWDQIS